VVKTTIQI